MVHEMQKKGEEKLEGGIRERKKVEIELDQTDLNVLHVRIRIRETGADE